MRKILRLAARALPLCLAVAGQPLAGQRRPDPVIALPIDSVLARFENDKRDLRVSAVPIGVIDLPRTYAARQDSLLNGLERLARTNPNNDVRRSAVLLIAVAGEVRPGHTAIPGIVPRLLRIYRAEPASDPGAVRSVVRAVLPAQTERAAAIALLRAAAAEPDEHEAHPLHGLPMGDPRTDALAQLARMGEQGRATLQAMHRAGEARSPQARFILDLMAERGFPVTEARRQ